MKKTKNKKQLRIPRPLGLTQTLNLLNLQKQNNNITEEKYNIEIYKIQNRLIEQYINNGFQLNQQPINIDQLAHYIGLTPIQCLYRFNDRLKALGKAFNILHKDLTSGYHQSLFKMGLSLYQKSQLQSDLLLRNQKGKYVPFLSNAVNQAIANEATAMKPLLELTKIIADIQKHSLPEEPEVNHNYITTQEAVHTIQNHKGTLLTNPTLLQEKQKELQGLPNINARTHTDLGNIGLKANEEVPKHEVPDELRAQRDSHIEINDVDEFRI